MRRAVLVGAALAAASCGIDPAKVPAASVYATHGAAVTAERPLHIAVVGATQGPLALGTSEKAESVVADIRGEAPVRDIGVVWLTGDQVSRSSTSEWTAFGKRWADILELPVESTNKARKPAMGMPGDGERAGDKKLVGYGAAFPDQAIDIGYNREASWGYVDVTTKGKVWRLLTVDSRRSALGSRWDEQLFWLPQVVTGDAFDHLIVFMPDPLVTLSAAVDMDRDGGPSELIGIIDDHAGIGKMELIVAGGTGTNEFFLPTGVYGEGFLVAGNGGVAGPNMARWARGADLPFKEITHEPLFLLSVMEEFDVWARDLDFTERVRDMAKGQGAWEGFDAVIDGDAFQLVGWWELVLDGDVLTAGYRTRRHDGTFHDLYTATLKKNGEWTTAKR